MRYYAAPDTLSGRAGVMSCIETGARLFKYP